MPKNIGYKKTKRSAKAVKKAFKKKNAMAPRPPRPGKKKAAIKKA